MNSTVVIPPPVDKAKLVELLEAAPLNVLLAGVDAVKWLDDVKRAAKELK